MDVGGTNEVVKYNALAGEKVRFLCIVKCKAWQLSRWLCIKILRLREKGM